MTAFAAIIEDGELDALTNALADSFVEDGSEVLSAETYPHAENTVLRFGYLDTDEDGSTDYNVTFFTVCGENTVRIDFWFPFSAGSAEQDALADGVIDSMSFPPPFRSRKARRERPKPSSPACSLPRSSSLLASSAGKCAKTRKPPRKRWHPTRSPMSHPRRRKLPPRRIQNTVPLCGEKIPAEAGFCPRCGAAPAAR